MSERFQREKANGPICSLMRNNPLNFAHVSRQFRQPEGALQGAQTEPKLHPLERRMDIQGSCRFKQLNYY